MPNDLAATLDGLAAPSVIEEVSFETIDARVRADAIGRLPALADVLNGSETEPARIVLEAGSFREMLIRARLNDVARANLLFYATGTDLDHLGVFYDVVRLAGESDAAFKARIILSIQGRSTGGTAPRYKAVALGASIRVADAIVYRDGVSPVVHVALYATDNGGVADDALVATVQAALDDPAVRMVNDTIVVASAAFTTINIAADVWLLPQASDTVLQALPTQLRAAWTAETGLGFDLVRAWISARLMQAGAVQKVVVTAPDTDVVAPPYQAIALGTITLTNRGRAY